jgi:hypothetical protein
METLDPIKRHLQWKNDPVRLAKIEERKKDAADKAAAAKEKNKAFTLARKAEHQEKLNFLRKKDEEWQQQLADMRAADQAAEEAAAAAKAAQAQQIEQWLEAARQLREQEAAEAEEARKRDMYNKALEEAKAAEEEAAAAQAKIEEEFKNSILTNPHYKTLSLKGKAMFWRSGGVFDLSDRAALCELERKARSSFAS